MPYEYDNCGIMYVLFVFLTFSLFEWGFNIFCVRKAAKSDSWLCHASLSVRVKQLDCYRADFDRN
jgi:hypothetical protein